MSIFITLLLKLLPLYTMVLLGCIAGKKLEVKKESIAQLLIYIIAPIVVFSGVVTTQINAAVLSLPILFFLLCCLMCVIFYYVGKLFWPGSEKNILAYACGSGNTGYFGLPVVLILLGDQFLGIAIMAGLGFILFENSLGFFITARGHHTMKEALHKVLGLPALYALILGLVVNSTHLQLSPIILDAFTHFKGVYIVLGMMLVGLGLSQVTRASFDIKFTAISFLAKFLVWPLIICSIIFIDSSFLHFYSSSIHKIMLLMSIVPLAANTVAYATKLNTHPEKVAVTVLLSTLFALVYIPLFISLIF